jgi:phosphoglycerate kinase
MQLPTIDSLDIKDRRVLVRGDIDVGIKEDNVSKRLEVLIETINIIFEKGARQVTICGHHGRPDGKRVDELSNKFLIDYFSSKLNSEVEFIEDVNNYFDSGKRIRLLENLRFWEGEEKNDEEFAHKLATFGDVYINEAFGNSHREHASMVGLPGLLPHAAGPWLIKEVENLSRVTENPDRPMIFVISGAKRDKIDMVESFTKLADKVLVGGRLPDYLPEDYEKPKVMVAGLIADKEDITMRSIEKFEKEIERAKTIVLAGVLGKYEDPGHSQGTERVFRAVAGSTAFKVVGGGDSLVVISMLGLTDKFDWVSVGGGAMLEFLARGTLPGIEALL